MSTVEGPILSEDAELLPEDVEVASTRTSRPWKAVAASVSCIAVLVGLSLAIATLRQETTPEAGSFSEQVDFFRSMMLYQESRLLTDGNLRDHMEVQNTLPAPPNLWWKQKELDTVFRKLGYTKSYSNGTMTITQETTTDIFVRVSHCICDASLISLKLMSALLSIDASVHVCLVAKQKLGAEETTRAEEIWTGNRRLASSSNRRENTSHLRRLAFNIPGSDDVEHQAAVNAEMACATNINGIISSFTAVGQYVSDSVSSCPEPQDVPSDVKDRAQCSQGINLIISGATKSGSALSDIATQCRDPSREDAVYAQPKKESKQQLSMAACLNNIGQATTYLAKVGYSLNSIASEPGSCPDYPSPWQRADCDNQIAGLLANIGQVATYLTGASAGCGPDVLLPFACASRVAATVTGLADVAQAGGMVFEYCKPATKAETHYWDEKAKAEKAAYNKKYVHTIDVAKKLRRLASDVRTFADSLLGAAWEASLQESSITQG